MHIQLHWAAAIIHTVSSILSIANDTGGQKRSIYVQRTTYEKNYITKVSNENLGSQDVLAWIFANEALTALSHFIALGYYYMYDERRNDSSPNHEFEVLRRTLEYSLTAAILQVALVLGVSDVALHDVIFIFAVNAVIQMIGYRIDNGNSNRTMYQPLTQSSNNYYVPAFVLLASEIAYVSILLFGVDYSVFSNSTFYVLVGVSYILFYVSFGLIKLVRSDEEDEIYIILSVTCKVSLSWLLISNVYTSYYELCTGESEACTMAKKSLFYGDWFAWQIVLIIFGVAGLIWSGYKVYKNIPTQRTLY